MALVTGAPRGDAATETVLAWAAPPLVFGTGAIDEAGHHVARLGLRRVVVVTDAGVVRAGIAARAERALALAGVEHVRFEDVHIEPTDASARSAVAWVRTQRTDGLVAVGGGSVIDTAKAMALLAGNPGDLADFLAPPIGRGLPPERPPLPVVAIPTTAGTGAESTPVCVLDVRSLHLKAGISHPALRPRLAIVDPSVTRSLPREATISSGLDVLCHALESWTAIPYDARPAAADPARRPAYQGANPIADVWAEQALRLLGRWFRRAVAAPDDLEARSGMMLAATFAGMGFGNAGVHLPHACAYPIAGMVRGHHEPGYPGDEPFVPHGRAVAVTAQAAFRFTYPAAPARHEHAARLLGAAHDGAGPELLPDVLRALDQDLGIRGGLRALGFDEADVPALAAGAWQQQRLLAVSPRPTSEADLVGILEASLDD
jgi:alcohol dehydrogenase class IV